MFGSGKRPISFSVLAVASILGFMFLTGPQNRSAHSRASGSPNNASSAVASFNDHDTGPQGFDKSQVELGYANLPLSFEPNRGQSDPRVRFLSRAGKRTLWLTKEEAVLALGNGTSAGLKPATKTNRRAPQILRMKFVGASADPHMAGESRQEGTVNYFSGKRSDWHTGIPTYARVRYSSLYPGIDLVFYGNKRQLEYDLVISPGADAAQIRFGISGAESMRIDGDGNLVLKTAAGDLIQQKPRIYQRRQGNLVAVSGDYVITGDDEIGFKLGSYDHQIPLVIDPVLRYASYLTGGGDESEVGTGIAVDSANRAVVSGWTCSMSFPGENGPSNNFCPSAFVIKFDYTGSRMVFTAFIPGTEFHDNIPLALDAAGNIYIAGSTFGNTFGEDTFKPTPNAFQTTFGGATDAWVAKLNSSGTQLIYATFLGGSGDELVGGIAVDSSGNAYVTGSTTSKNFPVIAGSFQTACKLKSDGSCSSAFVIKLNSLGTRALYSSYLGGHGTQDGMCIAVNPSGNAIVAGGTDASDFPTTAGTAQPQPAGSEDAFVTQFSSSGSHLNYSTLIGGSGADAAAAVALDSTGNAFITGRAGSTNFPVKNAMQPVCGGGCVFVSKLSPSLGLLYSTFLGGASSAGNVSGTGIAVTAGGQAFITGEPGPKFPITQNAFQRVLGPELFGGPPGGSVFISKLTAAGRLSYSSYFGGGLGAPRVALDKSANAYLTGSVSYGGTIPVTPGAFQQERGPEMDAFFAKVVAACAMSTVDRSVTICSPASGTTVASPVRIIAGTTDITPVKLTQVYLDGKKIYEAGLSAINVALSIPAGSHRVTVQAFDTANVIFKKSVTITVK